MAALVFPRNMIAGRRWDAARFTLQRRQEMSRTRGGRTIVADLGPPLWRAAFRSFPLQRNGAEALLADFETLGGAVRSFYAHPAKRPIPGAYADVSGFNLASVAVRAVSTDRQRIGLDGLPVGFVLTAGDFVSVRTIAGGREFLRLAEGGTADGAGSAPMLSASQPIRPAVAPGDPVGLVNPVAEMVLAPDTLRLEAAGGAWSVLTFETWQVIR